MSRGLPLVSAALALAILAASVARGAGVQAVAPIEGYACMQLARDATHLMDPASAPPMLSAPSADAPTLGTAPYVVIARVPARVVNGYAETLWLGSTRDHPVTGWVSAGVLLPFRSTTEPGASCTPTWMSNGRAGVLTR
jgi:hypothetical protein